MSYGTSSYGVAPSHAPTMAYAAAPAPVYAPAHAPSYAPARRGKGGKGQKKSIFLMDLWLR